jgi:hypothetical protein
VSAREHPRIDKTPARDLQFRSNLRVAGRHLSETL